MFPNQPNRDSWGSVAGYYGNYGMSGSWYNWAGQPNSRQTNSWGYHSNSPPPGGGSAGGGGEGGGSTALAYDREREVGGGGGASKMAKLGINSNIYSIYHNRGQTVAISPDVTISSMATLTRRDANEEEGGGFHGGRRGGSGGVVHTESAAEAMYTACMQQQGATAAAAHCNSLQQQQQQGDQHKDLTRRLVIDEGPSMEPDSSTDLSAVGLHSQQQQQQMPVNQPGKIAEGRGDQQQQEDDDELEQEQEKMFHNSRHFAQYFKLKSEPPHDADAATGPAAVKPPKFFKSPRREFSELLKEANEKMASKLGHNGLPLSVEIEELDSSSDSTSPPRNLSMSYFPNSMVSNVLSPRKRGRKPKHYSEILYELGQRGISITKTHKMAAAAAAAAAAASSSSSHHHHHHQPPHQQHHSSFQQSAYSPSPPSAAAAGNHLPVEGGSSSSGSKGPGSQQQLKCPHCNKILTTSVGLMYHIRLHTGEKPYACDLCGKSFATSSHYHYHIRTHSGEKPYRRVPFRCDFCGKMYTASGSLRLHLKSHLSRLAANAFNLNSLGMNGSSDGAAAMGSVFRGLEAMFAGDKEPLAHHQQDLAARFAQIKQEIMEAEPEEAEAHNIRARAAQHSSSSMTQQQQPILQQHQPPRDHIS